MNSVLFLSHAPHDAHRGFAEAVGARTVLLPFEPYIRLTKRFHPLRYAYPFCTGLYGSFIPSHENIVLADGASSLFAALALKKRRPRSRLVYLDADLFFYNLYKNGALKKAPYLGFLREIDGVMSVSEENKKYCARFLDTPMRVCPPFPKSIQHTDSIRRPYGLYVGRLDPDKNIRRIVEFGLQCSSFEKFVVVGDGVLRHWVENSARKNEKLLYAGTQHDIEKYYNECQFLVHIPDHDPHPTTPMEAAQGGCIPLMTRGIGTARLFDDLFLVDDPDDFPSIHARIRWIMDHKDEAEALLRQSTTRIPTQERSLREFRDAFYNLIEEIR